MRSGGSNPEPTMLYEVKMEAEKEASSVQETERAMEGVAVLGSKQTLRLPRIRLRKDGSSGEKYLPYLIHLEKTSLSLKDEGP